MTELISRDVAIELDGLLGSGSPDYDAAGSVVVRRKGVRYFPARCLGGLKFWLASLFSGVAVRECRQRIMDLEISHAHTVFELNRALKAMTARAEGAEAENKIFAGVVDRSIKRLQMESTVYAAQTLGLTNPQRRGD